jgi:hypothetical protein
MKIIRGKIMNLHPTALRVPQEWVVQYSYNLVPSPSQHSIFHSTVLNLSSPTHLVTPQKARNAAWSFVSAGVLASQNLNNVELGDS